MAEYEVERGGVGLHEKTLTPNEVDVVHFAQNFSRVEVYSDGTAPLYVTVDAGAPSVGGSDAWFLPAEPSVRVMPSKENVATSVRLISSGAVTYSISKGVA